MALGLAMGLGFDAGLTEKQQAVSYYNSIGSPIVVYDARFGLTLSGSAVVSWAPLLGTGTLTAPATNRRPTLSARSDGKPVVVFDGGDDMLNGTIPAVTQTAYSVGFAGMGTTTSGARDFYVNRDVNNRLFDVLRSTPNYSYTNVKGGVVKSVLVAQSATNPQTYAARVDADSIYARHNGVENTTVAAGAVSGGSYTNLIMGAFAAGSSHGNVQISALVLWGSISATLADVITVMQSNYPGV